MIHFISEIIHQFGHATAAKRTGYPMKGVRFWWILGQSIYPLDEGELSARKHVQRALGGPIISLALTTVCGVLALLLSPIGGVVKDVAMFAFLDNLLFYTIGSFMPLGFTDGSTLIRYLGK
jgi:Zn-dependent protease